MRKKLEYIPANKSVQKNWLICIGIYVLFLLWLEPIIDWLLTLNIMGPDQAQLDLINQRKAYVAGVAFGVARSIPLLLFLWFGWLIYATQALPPRRIKLPFSACRVEGRKVRMYGMLIILVALILLFREIQLLATTQPAP